VVYTEPKHNALADVNQHKGNGCEKSMCANCNPHASKSTMTCVPVSHHPSSRHATLAVSAICCQQSCTASHHAVAER
jgi:hypothetical protein